MNVSCKHSRSSLLIQGNDNDKKFTKVFGHSKRLLIFIISYAIYADRRVISHTKKLTYNLPYVHTIHCLLNCLLYWSKIFPRHVIDSVKFRIIDIFQDSDSTYVCIVSSMTHINACPILLPQSLISAFEFCVRHAYILIQYIWFLVAR